MYTPEGVYGQGLDDWLHAAVVHMGEIIDTCMMRTFPWFLHAY